ncbi:MAG: fructosamine kinase family protein [Saprospiraceae bacterium]
MFFDLPPTILQQCSLILDSDILSVHEVSGGDINQARLLVTGRGRFFLKMNTGKDAAAMFEAEAKGLDMLRKTKTLPIPATLAAGNTEAGAFLLMEFIETGHRAAGFWETFGEGLAHLHRTTASQFGLDHSNFIGSLRQSNQGHGTWPAFYAQERLQPQLELAVRSNRLPASEALRFEKLYQKLPGLCPDEPPALTHGDLWSGNFLVSNRHQPVLIDPAVSYAHREMDLAMSRLFGGFDRPFYRSYEETWPLEPGFEQRLPVYQLYYLMVHVNLFGGGYAGSVRSVLDRFI